MPRFLKAVYIGAAVLAVVAFLLGFYDYVVAGNPAASFGGDVFLPLAVLVIVVLLYLRRKREMEARRK